MHKGVIKLKDVEREDVMVRALGTRIEPCLEEVRSQ